MDLSTISTKPQLVKITLDDQDIIKDFGEPLDFYTMDRQPLDTYLTLSNALGNQQEKSVELLKTLILDKDGKPIMSEGRILPAKVMVKAMTKVMDLLGK